MQTMRATDLDQEPESAAISKKSVAGLDLAFFMPDLRGGGAERVMLDLVNEMAERGAKVELLLAKREGPYLEQLSPKVKVTSFDKARTLMVLPDLIRYFRNSPPDVFCSMLNHANIVSIVARQLSGNRKTSLAVTIHNNMTVKPGKEAKLLARLEASFMRSTYNKADLAIACGQAVERTVRQVAGVRPEKSTFLPVVFISPDILERSKEPAGHPWLDNKTVPVFTHFGRLTYQKDHANLIAAFAKVRAQRPSRLILFGEGELRGPITEQVKSLGLENDVDLPGFTNNPFSKMRVSDAVVLSSKFEGLPAVLVQAMACGAPVVSTDCECGPDEILAGGKWGRLVPIEDADALAQGMLETLDNPILPTEESWIRFRSDRAFDEWESTFVDLYRGKASA